MTDFDKPEFSFNQVEQAVRNAVLETIERCADTAQFLKRDERFDDCDPRMFALHNQVTADAIRALTHPSQPRPVEHEG